MNLLNHYVIALVITAFATFLMGILVYIKGRKKQLNRIFALYSLSIAIWSLGESYLVAAPNETIALFWAREMHIGVVFIVTFFVHFVFELLNIYEKKRKIIYAVYIYSFIFLLLDFTKFFIPEAVHKLSVNYFLNPGPAYFPFVCIWLGLATYGTIELFKVYLQSSGARRNQLKYLCWGTLLGYAGGPANFLLVFNIEVPFLNPFGTYAVPIYVLLTTYAIIKYRLMDINIIMGKLATYLFLLVILSGVYLGLMLGMDRVFSKLPAYNPFVSHFLIFLLLSIALIYLIPRIKGNTGEGIEKIFFKNNFKHREALKDFSKRLMLIPSEEQLLRESVNNIATAMEVTRVAILLPDDLSGNYIVRASWGLNEGAKQLAFTPQDGIIQWLTENKKAFFVEEIDKILSSEEVGKIKIELKDIQAVICLPLIIHNELGGVLALGEKLSGEMFSHIDIDLLEDFANQLVLSISYKRLESRMMRADRLVSLGTLAAGMAHEIRNPLSSIQTFAQLLPEKYNDKEFREEFSKIVASDTQRISRIIESVMALVKSKPAILGACNINKLLDETLFLIESELKKDGVKVTRSYDKQLPQINADKEQLQQTFLNIFLNALAALSNHDGKLTISTRQKLIPSVLSGREEKYAQIEIKDNGIGIEKRLLERIFEPFFTTRPDGTGLGLSIVHRIVEQHRGFVSVDSESGKGTAFLINLPMERKND